MAFDLNKWLVDEMKFTADEAKELSTRFTPERVEALSQGYSRQDDYSRSMNELQKAQNEHAAAVQRINNEYLEWGKIAAGDKAAQDELRRQQEQSQIRITQLTNRIQHLAQQTGQDPAKILADLNPVEPPKPPAGPDLSGYSRVEDMNRHLGNLADGMLTLPAALDDLRDEHHDLFGKRLNTSEIVKEIKARASTPGNQKSLDPRAVWEELHKVSDRRAEVQAAELKQIRESEYERGRTDALSQSVLPGSTQVPGKAHAPLFREQRTSKLQRPQPESSVMAAAAAFRSGKYRKEGAGRGGT